MASRGIRWRRPGTVQRRRERDLHLHPLPLPGPCPRRIPEIHDLPRQNRRSPSTASAGVRRAWAFGHHLVQKEPTDVGEETRKGEFRQWTPPTAPRRDGAPTPAHSSRGSPPPPAGTRPPLREGGTGTGRGVGRGAPGRGPIGPAPGEGLRLTLSYQIGPRGSPMGVSWALERAGRNIGAGEVGSRPPGLPLHHAARTSPHPMGEGRRPEGFGADSIPSSSTPP